MPEQDFQWDENKNQSNIEKHGISFDEASKVFSDESRLTIPDDRKDYGELREISIGQISLTTDSAVIIIVVVHTDRYGSTRIISARRAKEKERQAYEKTKEIQS